MNYEEATKKVRAAKKPESYLTFYFGYSNKYVLPHKEGLLLIQALAGAELIPSYISEREAPSIKQIDTQALRMETMSQEEYEDLKIAALLGIPVKDLQQAKNPTQEA